MPTPFATIAARLGVASSALLADATLTAGATTVDGIFDEALDAPGEMLARRAAFYGPHEDIDALALAEGDAVTVTRDSVATAYLLALPPQPLVALGQIRLDLKRAALA